MKVAEKLFQQKINVTINWKRKLLHDSYRTVHSFLVFFCVCSILGLCQYLLYAASNGRILYESSGGEGMEGITLELNGVLFRTEENYENT
jgi:hypothetical protein